MGIETATFVADLVSANPGAADLRSQGDDHLRLLKAVLQATFPTASKAFYNPTVQAKSADFTVVAADMNKTFFVDPTAGIVNMTLPSLGAGDAGWECFMMKSSGTTNPVLIKPPSGLLASGPYSVAAARRAVPNIRIQCLWTGSSWIVSRAFGVPLGSLIDFSLAFLPVGLEWPSGQTLASASTNYAEFFAANGSGLTLDVRGRTSVPLDNLGGSAAGRIAAATSVGVVGGAETKTLITANLPAYTPMGSVALTGTALSTSFLAAASLGLSGGVVTHNYVTADGSGGVLGTVTAGTFTGIAQGGSSTAFSILSPYIALSKLLVVE